MDNNSSDKEEQYLKERENEIKKEVDSINLQIKRLICFSVVLISIGFIPFFHGIFEYLVNGIAINELGDYLSGSVASIWSLAGLILIYIAFLGQRVQILNQQLELVYNRIELKATRYELKGQKEQMEIQNKNLLTQQFETTFFNLLNNMNSLISSIDLDKSNMTGSILKTTGKDCFKIFYKRLMNEFKTLQASKEDNRVSKYSEFFTKHQNDIVPYFNNISIIAQFVDDSYIENKESYMDIFKAQFSNEELVLIFYHSALYPDREMNLVLRKYRFFKEIPKEMLFERGDLKQFLEI